MINISGRYELDREKSESLYSHMKALGCEEIAALASEKLQVTVDIIQTDTDLTIWQNSQLGDTKRVLFLREETIESDARKASVTLTPTSITIETTFPKGKLVDKRQYEEEGEMLMQVLELTVHGVPGTIKTRRFMKKVGPPEPTLN